MTVPLLHLLPIGLLFQRRAAAGPAPPARLTPWSPWIADRRAEIIAGYPFPLDHFQLEAIDALDAGHHVVVAAPTGSGKTVVAEYGIESTRQTAGGRSTRRR